VRVSQLNVRATAGVVGRVEASFASNLTPEVARLTTRAAPHGLTLCAPLG